MWLTLLTIIIAGLLLAIGSIVLLLLVQQDVFLQEHYDTYQKVLLYLIVSHLAIIAITLFYFRTIWRGTDGKVVARYLKTLAAPLCAIPFLIILLPFRVELDVLNVWAGRLIMLSLVFAFVAAWLVAKWIRLGIKKGF